MHGCRDPQLTKHNVFSNQLPHRLPGTHRLHTSAPVTNYQPLNVNWTLTSSSRLSPKSHPVPAPRIRFIRFWRYINFMYVCMYFKSPVSHIFHQSVTILHVTDSWDEPKPGGKLPLLCANHSLISCPALLRESGAAASPSVRVSQSAVRSTTVFAFAC